MMDQRVSWVWNTGAGMGALGLLLFTGYVLVTAYHLRQAGASRIRVLSEGLKLLGAILLLLTLFQPEVHTRTVRNDNARMAVILDETDSMLTPDVEVEGRPVPRREWMESLRNSPEWAALADAVRLEILPVTHDAAPVYKQTDLRGALAQARDLEQISAVLMLSDGGHNAAGSPLPDILRLAENQVPVYAVEIGQRRRLPDLVLEPVAFPSYTLINETMILPVRVSSTLPEDAPVHVVLLANGQPVARQEVLVPAGRDAAVPLRYIPREEGVLTVSVQVEPHPLERFLENNELTADVAVRRTTIRVLLIDSLPRWEFRYLRNALNRDPGVEVDSLLFHPELGVGGGGPGYLQAFPETREAWSAYDVVFMGDVGLGNKELESEDLRAIDLLVREQAAGLVFLPGPRGGHLRLLDTPLEALMPVEYDRNRPQGVGLDLEMRMALTREGQEHMLTQLDANPVRNRQIWRQVPGFNWYAAVTRAKVGAEVLATHASQRTDSGRIPLLVTRNAGTGHVLFLGTDAAWRWRTGVEDLYHYRFWGQVVRWMAHRRNMFGEDGARVFLQPERPEIGQTVNITVALRSAFAPSDAPPVRLRLQGPDGALVTPLLSPLEGGGTFAAVWNPSVPGPHTLELFSPEDPATAWFTTQVQVEGRVPEQLGEPLRPALLREAALITGGSSVSMEEAASLLIRLRELPRQQVVVSIHRIWQHPLWVTGVFVFFGLYWILRKRQGWI